MQYSILYQDGDVSHKPDINELEPDSLQVSNNSWNITIYIYSILIISCIHFMNIVHTCTLRSWFFFGENHCNYYSVDRAYIANRILRLSVWESTCPSHASELHIFLARPQKIITCKCGFGPSWFAYYSAVGREILQAPFIVVVLGKVLQFNFARCVKTIIERR